MLKKFIYTTNDEQYNRMNSFSFFLLNILVLSTEIGDPGWRDGVVKRLECVA